MGPLGHVGRNVVINDVEDVINETLVLDVVVKVVFDVGQRGVPSQMSHWNSVLSPR